MTTSEHLQAMDTLPTLPNMISHYRLIERLGRGAMGEVWLAEDTRFPRQVAVKLLSPFLADDADAVTRLMREAQATASIDHPAVVTVYETGEAGGRPYIVMQCVQGETLAQRLERGPLGIPEAVAMARQVADALAEVHALGIVHRDLKPSNLMLTPRGVKILDFGVASVKALPKLTAQGSAIGTPKAMSPEQVQGLPADNRSDLWALGVILYESLTGREPFEGETASAVIHQVLNRKPPLPSTLRSDISPDLDHVVQKLLRRDAAHRYPRAEDLLADLASIEETGSGLRTVKPEASKPAQPRLAILPFEVMSSDPEDGFLAGGLTEDLIVDLTRVEGVQVASRAEVAPYAERTVPPRTLGRELGVDYVLMGSVRRAGNRARINAQLARTADGHVLWGERFDRNLEDLFDVQEEVSRKIVDALQVALKPEEDELLQRAPTRNTEAYTLYLRARELIGRSRDENYQAERLLLQALDLDPEFALAHAALGECYATSGLSWWGDVKGLTGKARAAAKRALELEPDLPDATFAELMVRRMAGDPHEVLEAIDSVLQRIPGHAQAREWAAWSYLTINKPEQALPILEQLVEEKRDRYRALTFLQNCYQMLGREEDVKRTDDQMYEVLAEVVQKDPQAPYPRSLLANALLRKGEVEAGAVQAERAVALAPDDGRIRYNAACFYAQLGEGEKAMEHLREGIKNVPSYIADWPRHDPDLASLHDDPEFIRLFGRA